MTESDGQLYYGVDQELVLEFGRSKRTTPQGSILKFNFSRTCATGIYVRVYPIGKPQAVMIVQSTVTGEYPAPPADAEVDQFVSSLLAVP